MSDDELNLTNDHVPAGLDLSGIDASVKPGDDFYRHVNGAWIATASIDPDKTANNAFVQLADRAKHQVRDIIEAGEDAKPGTPERLIGDLYASYLDVDTLKELGTAPLEPELARVAALADVESLVRLSGELAPTGVASFVSVFSYADPGDPGTVALFVSQSGLGLPDEEYYRLEEYARVREGYERVIARLLGLAGLDDAAGRARRVLALETEIAAHHLDKVSTRDIGAQYHPMQLDEAAGLMGERARLLHAWVEAFGVAPEAFARPIVMQPDYLRGVAQLFTDDRLESWRDWLAWRLVAARSSFLSPEFEDAAFAFFGRELQGQEELPPRWRRAVDFTEGAAGEAVGRAYVSKHFAPESKAQVRELVDALLAAYRDSIEHLEWMTDETRAKALEKLASFTPKIGYPDSWRSYEGLEAHADDLYGNAIRAARFDVAYELEQVGHPVNRDRWGMTPQTVNAYYSPLENEIVFPAAILQLPMFSPDRDAAANFGAIGAVIGHEIGHGFDDQGSQFDGDGRLENWWSEADLAAFKKRTSALVQQYDGLRIEGVEGAVNGELTLGENIGDLGGLGIALKAYLASLGDEEAPVIDGFTGVQRFFVSWAIAWRQSIRPERQQLLIAVDPHSPNELRCNRIVANLDAFVEAFDVQPGDRLWLDPGQRVSIW